MKEWITKQKNNFKKHQKGRTILLFLLLFFFGLSFLKEVGVNYDEKAEQNILKMNILEYANFLKPQSDLVKFYKEEGIVPIYQSVEKDHGISPYYLFTPFLTLNKVSEHTLSLAWHLYTYILFFIGVIFCYKLIKELWNSKPVALLTTLIYFLTPRIFADGLYNNKDCILITFVFMMLYYGIKWIREKSYKEAILFGLVSAVSCNLKVSGGFVFASLGILYLITLTKEKSWNKKNFFVGLTALLSCIIIYLLLTPAIWAEGWHLLDFFKWSLENSVNFSRNYGKVFFEGTLYQHWENPLPWYYLPKIIFLTLPIYVSVLILTGVILTIKKIVTKQYKKEQNILILAIILSFFPLLISMVSNPNIYNGWRHFYFLYPSMLILLSYALFCIFKNTKYKKISFSILFICLLGNGVGIILNGTTSTMYYNWFAKNPTENYEMDYYGVSATKILQDLAKDNKENIYVYSYSDWALLFNYEALSHTNKEKIVLLKNEEELTETIEKGIQPYYIYFETYDREYKSKLENKEKIKEYKAWGNTYASLYR